MAKKRAKKSSRARSHEAGRHVDQLSKDDFVGRHLIVDASTVSRRNLTSTDTVFALFEALNRSLDMTAVLPPIVCRLSAPEGSAAR